MNRRTFICLLASAAILPFAKYPEPVVEEAIAEVAMLNPVFVYVGTDWAKPDLDYTVYYITSPVNLNCEQFGKDDRIRLIRKPHPYLFDN